MIFRDRRHAGELLAKELAPVIGENHSKALILALPRGGVPVAEAIAARYTLPMDVLVVRKIGAPFNQEFALGAICETAEPVFNKRYLNAFEMSDRQLSSLIDEERGKIKNQIRRFRQGQKLAQLSEKTVVIVDDGLATGATMVAGINYLKSKNVRRIVVAVPIASSSAADKIRPKVESMVCIEESDRLRAVGDWYDDFSQVSDEEVEAILAQFQISAKKEKTMATEQKATDKKTMQQKQTPSDVLDTAGGEMPNPKAPPHGPTEEELSEVLKKSMGEKKSMDDIPDSEGDFEDQAEREVENDRQSDIDNSRRDVRH